MNAVVLFLGLLLLISTNAAVAKSVHGNRENGISDIGTLGECSIRIDTLQIPNLEVTIPFYVTDCYTLAARNDKVEVYTRPVSLDDEKFVIILYDGNHLKVTPHSNDYERYFTIQLNHKIINASEFPPEISVSVEWDRGDAFEHFKFQKHGMTVTYRTDWSEVRIRPRGVDGLCGFHLHDPQMDELRRFQLKQIAQTPACHVDRKEMAYLSYRTNVSTRYTTKELKVLEDLAREMRASPKQMECAKTNCWWVQKPDYLYSHVKMWLQYPACTESVAENHNVNLESPTLKGIFKLLLGS